MRTAGQDAIEKLYHYEEFRADRLRDVLANHRIWVSSPAVFNDPWDFKFDFDIEGLRDPAIREEEIAGHIEVTTRRFPDILCETYSYARGVFAAIPNSLRKKRRRPQSQ